MRLADGSFFQGWARWCAGDGNGESQMREGLGLWDEMQYRLFAPLTGTLLAEREAEAGRVEAGLATLDRQVVATEETGQHWFDAEVHRVRGELLLKLPRPDVAAAESAFMRAIDIARSQQTRTFELRAALALAKFYRTTDRDQSASDLLGPALVGFDAGPEVPEVEEAQRLLRMHKPVVKRIGG
jgi:predicted ATPase